MHQLTLSDIVSFFVALGALLSVARILGELMAWFHQPAVLGEMLAGLVLGPTILGRFAPGIAHLLFPSGGEIAVLLNGMTTLAITLFLLVAGMEVDLSTVWRQGRTAVNVGLAGIILPFSLGLAAAWWKPGLLGWEGHADARIFALFIATALSISALPVIAKTLMDLSLYRSDLGMIVIAAAVFNDLCGWIIFAVLMGVMGASAGQAPGLGAGLAQVLGISVHPGISHTLDVAATIALTLLFALVMLTLGRWLIHRLLPYLQAHTTWPGGVLSFALALALFGAAFTEWIGVHAIFGSFLVGVAVGDSSHLRERTRTIILQFVSFIFAPLFFASIGLGVDFAAAFDLRLVAVVLLIACIGKVVGCGLGAALSGMSGREAWAVGFGMNARGAMEIILGLLALQSGLIRERLFVALVTMALVTSLISGPLMQRVLGLRRPRGLADFLTPKAFVNPLCAFNRYESIRELSRLAGDASGLKPAAIEAAVLEREKVMPTGIGYGVAVPHARVSGLSKPLLGLGISEAGVDFDAPDGQPAQLVFLILTPQHDYGAQLEILADIARFFRDEEKRQRAMHVSSYTEFLALLKTDGA